jgi:hypothetical protein
MQASKPEPQATIVAEKLPEKTEDAKGIKARQQMKRRACENAKDLLPVLQRKRLRTKVNELSTGISEWRNPTR